MPDNRLHADGARVLADLNALRRIGAYKTGVHKPTFSEPHMRSLDWLAQRLPEAASPRRSTASAMYSAQVRNPDRNCWPGRISKARISRAGSMGRLASCMPSKPPELSILT